ncbi:hypothetical protein [Streptomyces sp. NPDC091416]|uniref:hypothetical protein n=1 Tax=Streptomyces sp. NPDC091416 TaxID=3366003 RepID=UPI0037F653CF
MTRKRCVTCGSQRDIESVGGYEGTEVWACPTHRQGLSGEPTDELDDLTWLQETRPQRILDRQL